MVYLVEGIKQLPGSLKGLKLDLSHNNLGVNQQDFEFIGKLPKNLKYLFLHLSGCRFGDNMQNFVENMKLLPCNLQLLDLVLSENKLGGGQEKEENMKLLMSIL